MSSKPLPERIKGSFYKSKCILREGPLRQGRVCDISCLICRPLPARNVLGAVLGDGKVDGGDGGFMTAQDVLLIHDGRVSGNGAIAQKEVNKSLKGKALWGPRPARCLLQLRCLYHNREFMEGGALQRKKKNLQSTVPSQNSIPEPLETVLLLQGREAKIELKDRKWLDLPGNNASKSIAGLSLKGEEARLITTLTRECMTAMSQGEDSAARVAGSEDESAASAGEEAAEVPNLLCLHPWEADETACRELVRGYAPQKAVVVDFWAGASFATACCRDKLRYIGLVQSELARSILYEMVLLRIALDMCLDTADGFTRARRHLTRMESLGGTEPASIAPVALSSPAGAGGGDPEEDVLSDSGASE